jgi:hypothetical protein
MAPATAPILDSTKPADRCGANNAAAIGAKADMTGCHAGAGTRSRSRGNVGPLALQPMREKLKTRELPLPGAVRGCALVLRRAPPVLSPGTLAAPRVSEYRAKSQ